MKLYTSVTKDVVSRNGCLRFTTPIDVTQSRNPPANHGPTNVLRSHVHVRVRTCVYTPRGDDETTTYGSTRKSGPLSLSLDRPSIDTGHSTAARRIVSSDLGFHDRHVVVATDCRRFDPASVAASFTRGGRAAASAPLQG